MRKTAVIRFYECIQDSQDFGSTDEHMVSRVFFDLEINGEKYEGLSADLKQLVGSAFKDENIEVGPPRGYDGPFNANEFAKAAKEYYLGLVGPSASGIRIGEGATNIRMRNNRFIKELRVEIRM